MKIITVYNNKETYEKCVLNNPNLAGCELLSFDNTERNRSITECYNEFIDSNKDLEEDWYAFIHQDFGFLESPITHFKGKDKISIYGAVGVRLYKCLYINLNGQIKLFHTVNYGQIKQGNNNFEFSDYGIKLKKDKSLDSVDCCCIIVHSSLLNKYNLRFDENLKFHMYAEDLCYCVKHKYKLKIKVTQMDCYHLGKGDLNEEFKRSVTYLKQKYKLKRIPSTCPN